MHGRRPCSRSPTTAASPAPAVALRDPGSTIDGRRWFVMAMLPGSPAMGGMNPSDLVGGYRRLTRDLPRQTAEVHLALHRLDPAPLVDTFGGLATVERWIALIAATPPSEDGGHGLTPGVEWLERNAPEPRGPLVLCHGDTWGGNLLLESGEVTGLIDWTVATVAEPALEIAVLDHCLLARASAAASTDPAHRTADRPTPRRRLPVGVRVRERRRPQLGALLRGPSLPPRAERCRGLPCDGRVGVPYDGPPPTWDGIADQMVDYFEQRTGVHLRLPPAVR